MGLFSKPEVIILKETSNAKNYLEKLEQILPEAEGELKEKIQKEIAITKAGIAGEDNILFELKNSGMDLVVLQDICIESEQLSAQIDFFVVTPKMNFIIECKNLFGNIEIDSKGNFIRTIEYKGKKIKEGLYSPITQNERHLNVLKQSILQNAGMVKNLVVKSSFSDTFKPLVVLANPKTIVNDRYAKKEIKSQVIRADQLITTLKRMNAESKALASNKKFMLEVGNSWLSHNVEERKDYFANYEELLKELQDKKAQEKEDNSKKADKAIEANASREKETSNQAICPQCGGKLMKKKGRYGLFIGCGNYPECTYTQKL